VKKKKKNFNKHNSPSLTVSRQQKDGEKNQGEHFSFKLRKKKMRTEKPPKASKQALTRRTFVSAQFWNFITICQLTIVY
jgi:hypothetical protein